MNKKKLIGIIGACIVVVIVAIMLTLEPESTPLHTLTVDVKPAEAGSVFPPSDEYGSGVQVALTANPGDGYRFGHWSGDAAGTSPTTTVTMDRNRYVIANFVPISSPETSAFYLVYEADVSDIQPGERAETMRRVQEIIENRVDALGVAESIVQVLTYEGHYSIAVELPAIADIEEAKTMVGLVTVLEFREWGESEQEWIPAIGTATVNGQEKELVLSSRYFKEGSIVTVEDWTGRPLLVFEWDQTGRQLSQQITSRLLGKQIAIYLGDEPLLDEEGRRIAPVVQGVMTEGGQISGLNLATAQMLSRFLNAGRIPVPLGRWVGAGVFEPGAPLYAGQVTEVTLILFVHENTTAGPVIVGARVTGQDGAGNSFDQTVNTSGYVTVTGALGTWSLTVSKTGYDAKSWSQPITATETRHTYLVKSPVTIIATIETAKGNLVLELFAHDVPMTVDNFVKLARDGFYDGLTFHRVIPGFMAQGGCPIGDGRGGPGYRFDDEITEHTHVTGALSMANSGPNTNGSQFFITYAPQPHLDGKHTVFGQLIQGMDVLERLENGDVMIRITIQEG